MKMPFRSLPLFSLFSFFFSSIFCIDLFDFLYSSPSDPFKTMGNSGRKHTNRSKTGDGVKKKNAKETHESLILFKLNKKL